MDKIERLARDLGAAIQEDIRYTAYMQAREANEKDNELNELMGKVQLIHMSYGHEASKGEDADQEKLAAYEKEFNECFTLVKNNLTMVKYEAARDELDALMKYVTGILSMCACGEDPETCSPETQSSCNGDCGSGSSSCH